MIPPPPVQGGFCMQWLAVLGLFFASALWGFTFILVKWAVAEVDVYYFLFLRFTIAALALGIPFYKKLKWDQATLKASAILGLLLTTIYITQTEGLRFTSASNSALITGFYVVFIPFFLKIFFKVRSNTYIIAGALLSVAGLYLLTQYSPTGINVGDLLTLICAMACAVHVIYVGKYTVRYNSISLVVFQFLVVTLICGAVAAFRGSMTLDLSKMVWTSLLINAIFCSAIVFVIQMWAQKIVEPARAGVIFVSEAIFGTFFACWLGDERLTLLSWLGAGLMISGMFVSESGALVRRIRARVRGLPPVSINTPTE